MTQDNNKEQRFSEYLDKLLNAENVAPGDDVKDDVDFARKLMELRSEPAHEFKAALEKRLLTRLVEREQARAARKWWQFEPSLRWVSLAATATVVILAVVGFFGYMTLFNQPASAPSGTAIPTAPGKITTPSATSVPQTPTTPTTSPTMPAPSPPVPQSPQQSPGFSGPPRKSGGNVQISWPYYFENLSDLAALSDSIAVVTVIKAGQTTLTGNLYNTQWELRVTQVSKGPRLDTILVNQTGSPRVAGSDPVDDPLFRANEMYLLFLKESAPGEYTYFGPYGRYIFSSGGGFYSMNRVTDGYTAPPGLDINGTGYEEMTKNVVKAANAVRLVFTRSGTDFQTDVLRYPAGTTLQIDARLSSGEHGPAGVTLTIDKRGLPAGLDVSLAPAAFIAQPRNVYVSAIAIAMYPGLPPGTYYIPVDYNFGDSFLGRRTITLNVTAP